MAATQKKKTVVPGSRNPERRCGKAWKKDRFKEPKKRTPEAERRYQTVLEERARRRERNLLARQREADAQEALKAEQEREMLARYDESRLQYAENIARGEEVVKKRQQRVRVVS